MKGARDTMYDYHTNNRTSIALLWNNNFYRSCRNGIAIFRPKTTILC